METGDLFADSPVSGLGKMSTFHIIRHRSWFHGLHEVDPPEPNVIANVMRR
jgi:hypothetical protein